MNALKHANFEVNSDNWDTITKKLQQAVVKTISKFGPNARKSSAKFYVCINSDIKYKIPSDNRTISTTVKDLHTDHSQTLIELKDLKDYIEDYVETLQVFCENNNRGVITSAGEFVDFESVEIIVTKPVAFI